MIKSNASFYEKNDLSEIMIKNTDKKEIFKITIEPKYKNSHKLIRRDRNFKKIE